jgi:hypothetical protein
MRIAVSESHGWQGRNPHKITPRGTEIATRRQLPGREERQPRRYAQRTSGLSWSDGTVGIDLLSASSSWRVINDAAPPRDEVAERVHFR